MAKGILLSHLTTYKIEIIEYVKTLIEGVETPLIQELEKPLIERVETPLISPVYDPAEQNLQLDLSVRVPKHLVPWAVTRTSRLPPNWKLDSQDPARNRPLGTFRLAALFGSIPRDAWGKTFQSNVILGYYTNRPRRQSEFHRCSTKLTSRANDSSNIGTIRVGSADFKSATQGFYNRS